MTAVTTVFAALVILDVSYTAVPKKLVTCPHRFICPCGTTGTNVTFCAGVETGKEDVCSRWSECRSCRDDLGVCLECLEGSGGVHCPKGRKLVHRKRQLRGIDLRILSYFFRAISPSLSPRTESVPRKSDSRPFSFHDLIDLDPRERAETTPRAPQAICPDPGYDASGTRTPSHPLSGGVRDGTRVEYGCRVGYTLVGEGNITCLVTGQWSSERPRCRIPPRPPHMKPKYCQNPGPVSNGKITYYAPLGDETETPSSPDDPELPDGSRFEYTCDDDHLLQGQSELDCQRIGEWSYDPPRCTPNPVPERSEDLFCPDPGVDPNGSREPRLAPEGGRGFPPDTMLLYSCNPGYRITGTPIVFCYSYGDWSWEAPGCEPQDSGNTGVSFCQNPGPIANGRKVFFPAATADRRKTGPRRTSDDPEFPQGSRLSYTCKRGYALDGRGSITCGRNRQWSDDPPVCIRDRVFCPNPGHLPNGEVRLVPAVDGRIFRPPIQNSEGEPLEYPRGTRLLYSCDHGFSLRGANDITCRHTGKWSFPLPACMTIDAEYRMSCFNPGLIVEGSVRHVFPDVGTVVSKDGLDYPEGTRLEYECNEGFEVEGEWVVTCLSTGIWTSRPPVCTPDCGRSLVTADKKIVNGSQVEAGEWPWVVAIAVRRNNGRSRVVCGGAVIGPQLVITAAHCVNRGQPPFELYFGKYHRENHRDDVRVENRTSDLILIHPDFSNITMDSDIALITFEPRIQFSPLVQPICLPTTQSTAKNLRTGSWGHVSGWGLNENLTFSQELTMAHLPFVTKDTCTESFRQNVPDFNQTLTRNMFCAGFPDARQATCKGDSGSPMVFFDPVRERFTLEGLVSFGVPVQCGHPGVYTAFTRVFSFLSWINDVAAGWTCPCQNGGTCDSYGRCVCPGDRTGRLCETAVRPRVICDDPGFVQNGIRWKPGESPVSDRQTFEEEESVVFGCEDGYTLKGTALLTCQINGTWSKDLPQCVLTATDAPKIIRCPIPIPIYNGRIRSISPNLPPGMTYSEGVTLEYECKAGYELKGALKQTCQSSGRWMPLFQPHCARNCRRFLLYTSMMMVNGSYVKVGFWPWLVAISDRHNRLICGGAILNSQMIITTAQCVNRGGPFTLHFGKQNRENGLDDENVQNRTSDEILIHPNFRNNSYDSDIALVTFKRKIIFSPFIQPACLPIEVPTARFRRALTGGYVIEWGLVEKQADSQELTMAYLPYMNDSACIQMLPDFEPFFTRNMFCAGPPPNYSRLGVCNRDKGSPFVFSDHGLDMVILEGLVSFGLQGQCGLPTVFTKVFPFVPWINSHVLKRKGESEP